MWNFKIRIDEPATERSGLFKQLVEYKKQLGLNPDYNIEDVLIGKREYDVNVWIDTVVHLGTDKITFMTAEPVMRNGVRVIDRQVHIVPVTAFASVIIRDSVDALGNVDRNFKLKTKTPIIYNDKLDQRCDSIWLSCPQSDWELSSIIAKWVDKVL